MAVYPMPMLDVRYTCEACGIRDAVVSVRGRGPQEDIADWMKALTLALSIDHRKKSPRCRATRMTHAKIPLPPGHSRIGDPSAH
jgi:hypothetical protein